MSDFPNRDVLRPGVGANSLTLWIVAAVVVVVTAAFVLFSTAIHVTSPSPVSPVTRQTTLPVIPAPEAAPAPAPHSIVAHAGRVEEASPPVPPPPRPAPDGMEPAEERLPLRGLRRRIAETMVLSVTTMPQVTSLVEVDATGLVALRF